MLNLTVKNFGVLKDINIELNKTNLFIGDNGSGKSTLAKLITIVTDLTINEDEIIKRLKDFNIDFLNEECYIWLQEDDKTILEIKGLIITISKSRKAVLQRKKELDGAIQASYIINKAEKENQLNELLTSIASENQELGQVVAKLSKDKEYIKKLINTDKNHTYFRSQYIPAERNLISFFTHTLSNLISAEIPFPKTLLEFSAHYNSAKNEIKELDILGMKYKNENGQDRIYYKDNNSLALENSSSGIQSALPLYLTLKYFATKHRDIIIEEPELNLYPKSQIDTVKYMIENKQKSSLSIMTHSPYILSILNVLLFAYKASNTNNILKEKISKIIPQEQQINPDEFCAYLIKDGSSYSIKGESTGMIQENAIDEIGGMLDDDFNELMDIYDEFKSDK